MTNIEWTDETWNPVVGCKKVAPGCAHCYAETMAKRLAKMGQKQYAAVVNETGWNGKAVTVPEALDKPLRWRKGRRIFVCSMSDLFHDDVPFEYIAAVYGVMAACPQHTFQVLTKRPERMLEFMRWWQQPKAMFGLGASVHCKVGGVSVFPTPAYRALTDAEHGKLQWPLPNVWHGTSIANQADADKNIPILLQVPSAVRFVSAEPLVGPVDLTPWPGNEVIAWGHEGRVGIAEFEVKPPRLHWVIVGGESGPNARPCDVAWIRSIVEQCKAAGVACFVKQLGANIRDRNDVGFDADSHRYDDIPANGDLAGKPVQEHAWPDHVADGVEHNPDGVLEEYQGAPVRVRLGDPKGGDPSEWPEDLRVREFPATATASREGAKNREGAKESGVTRG